MSTVPTLSIETTGYLSLSLPDKDGKVHTQTVDAVAFNNRMITAGPWSDKDSVGPYVQRAEFLKGEGFGEVSATVAFLLSDTLSKWIEATKKAEADRCFAPPSATP